MTQTTNLQTTCVMQALEEERNPRNKKLDKTIMKAVDDSLSFYGSQCKESTYLQLDKTYHIKPGEIPEKIEEFAAAIEKIFGAASYLIEMKIIKELHDKIPGFVHFPRSDGLVFADYMRNLRYYC